MAKIEDFGNKIGGAKKDLWKLRGLILDDVYEMNDTERNKHIKKDNVWIKPDYQNMVDNGISKRVAYFIKTIRDSLPAKPQGSSHEYQEGYISFISDIRDKTMALTKDEEITQYFNDVILRNYVEKRGYSYIALPSTYGCVNNKLFRVAQMGRNLSSIDRKIRDKQFLYTEEEKILDRYSFYRYENIIWNTGWDNQIRMEIKHPNGTSYVYPKNEYAVKDNWKEGSYFVLDERHNIVINNISSLDKAKEIIIEASKEAEKHKEKINRKKRFIPVQLQHINRVGEEYRNSHNITGDDMLNVFGFYGGEFGNWLNEKDRQQNLNYSYDAFVDLAKALNISNEDIALNGELSIAYGARGRAGAVAHYEPERRVINLTKMSGAGSLAHEWGHALDHYLSRTLLNNEGYLSNSNSELIKPLVNVMQYKTLSPEESYKVNQAEYIQTEERYILFIKNTFRREKLSENQQEKVTEIIKNVFEKNVTFEEYVSAMSDKNFNNDAVNSFTNLQQIGIKNLTSDIKQNIVAYQRRLTELREQIYKPVVTKTKFYEDSKVMDATYSKEDKGYWSSTIEMFARAFACYVKDKLSPDRSDYLCGHAESCVSVVINSNSGIPKRIKAYPEGEERKNINKCIDELIEKVKEKGLFHDFNKDVFIFKSHYINNDIDISNDMFEQTSFFNNIDDFEPDICDEY